MTAASQILLGSALLTACALVHVGFVAIMVPLLSRAHGRMRQASVRLRAMVLTSEAVLLVLVAHTIQVWAWSLALYAMGAFADFPTSFYFATTTYTTLGYGDLVLQDGLRIFGTFAAITGLLTFGISTALLMGLVVRLLPSLAASRREDDQRH
ncbi:ion channel [uncultured Tateyamaria sp.]|uniref:ion channel n=1 Tax=uncultured Tateyamaria sp. TaxID=455651 RepID=UPI002607D28E|nr:ion channel [uncultured Tateyamaria sp.]